jgi:hypothetical protein
MYFENNIQTIFIFLALMVGMPLALGRLCRWLVLNHLPTVSSGWMTGALLVTALGWVLTFVSGRMGWMSYEASVLMGAMLFVPGQFCLSLFSTRR